jgi:hypothetical protein
MVVFLLLAVPPVLFGFLFKVKWAIVVFGLSLVLFPVEVVGHCLEGKWTETLVVQVNEEGMVMYQLCTCIRSRCIRPQGDSSEGTCVREGPIRLVEMSEGVPSSSGLIYLSSIGNRVSHFLVSECKGHDLHNGLEQVGFGTSF